VDSVAAMTEGKDDEFWPPAWPIGSPNYCWHQNPTAQQVQEWFDKAGWRPGTDGGGRREYPTPCLEACEEAAKLLAGIPALARDWRGHDRLGTGWHRAAKNAMAAAAWGWHDARKRPVTPKDDSAIVKFVQLALQHFGIHRGDYAVAKTLKNFLQEKNTKRGGVLAERYRIGHQPESLPTKKRSS
jgi:hypothetical protein